MLEALINGRFKRFYGWELPLSTWLCFCFCWLSVNASFSNLKIRPYAGGNARYGVLSMKWFTLISTMIYVACLACYPYHLLSMARARFNNSIMDRLQISLIILSEFKQINQLLFPQKLS